MNETLAEDGQAPACVRPKPLQKFLRRGEGTQKRVFGPQLSKQLKQQLSGAAYPRAQEGKPRPNSVHPSASDQAIPAHLPLDDELEDLAELQAETTLVQLEAAQRQNAGGSQEHSHHHTVCMECT